MCSLARAYLGIYSTIVFISKSFYLSIYNTSVFVSKSLSAVFGLSLILQCLLVNSLFIIIYLSSRHYNAGDVPTCCVVNLIFGHVCLE